VDEIAAPEYLRNKSLRLGEKKCSALALNEWPTSSELGLNDSQYTAFQNALTKEFSVIQGPPGTGKTYVGLKIVEALINNQALWNGQKRCILVVCYTNHALEQFLSGIIEKCQLSPGRLVRIGGKIKEDELSKFHITALRRNHKALFRYPKKRCFGIGQLKERIGAVNSQIDSLLMQAEIEKCSVLPLDELFSLGTMTARQYNSIKSHDRFYYGDEVENWLLMADQERARQNMYDRDCSSHDVVNRRFEEREDMYEENREGYGQDLYKMAGKFEKILKAKLIEHGLPQQLAEKFLEYRFLAPMEEVEAESVKNVWNLEESDRFRLYRYWQNQVLDQDTSEKLKALCADYNETSEELQEAYSNQDSEILSNAIVI
jgi:hypothetical protein